MLDDFKDTEFYNYVDNLKKYYHAYLFEVDDQIDAYPLILAFAKTIICKNHYKNKDKCLDCNICYLIDNNYYEDLKVIEPDGINIKKNQVLELQKNLSLKSVYNTNQVYIIKNAEKMNLSASNSLLKFIEEPQEGIYGILITTDRKQVIETIRSRCNLISLKSSNKKTYKEEDINNITNLLNIIFLKKEASIPELKETFFSIYENKEDIIKAFSIMEYILDNLIKYKFNISSFNKDYDIINKTLSEISNFDLIFYLDKVIEFKNKLNSIPNLNLNLFMDRFIIELSRNNCVR